jgi:ABC-type amino acid transport substrate-binding protein
MKKLVSLTLALLIALLALLPAMAEETRTVRTGMLSMLNVTEEEMVNYKKARALIGRQLEQKGVVNNALRQFLDIDAPEVNCEIVYFDTLDAMLMALNAGKIDEISIYETVAQYLTHGDPNLVQIMTFNEDAVGNDLAHFIRRGLLANDFAFMFMEDNTALRDEFDAALQAITDAEMEKLVQAHITAAINGDEISPIEMPVIEGAQTIKVAVTGSLPPMDYVAADGTPAGFNTALLAEISQRIGKNIELVVVDSVGRAAALASGNVDAVFWTRTSGASNELAAASEEERAERREALNQATSGENRETVDKLRELVNLPDYGRADMPEGTIITEPYFHDIIVPVTTQARLDKGDARANQ